MSASFIWRARAASRILMAALALALVVLACLPFLSPASAQETTPSATPAVNASNTSTMSRPVPPPEQLIWLVVVALLFAIATIGFVLLYTYHIQKRFYTSAEKLTKAGISVRSESTPAFSKGFAAGGFTEEGAPSKDMLSAASPPVIAGPARLEVGVESGEFYATQDDKALADPVWTIEPATAAIVLPPKGSARVKVLSATPGKLTLRVTTGSGDSASAETIAVPVSPQEIKDTRLPFVGAGYGSIIIAVGLLATVIVLALAGVLNGDGVSSLLGGLLGYIFGVGVATARSNQDNKTKEENP